MSLRQILKGLTSVFIGTLISILTDFFLSFLGPISWFFFYPKFVGVIFGSFIAGLILRKRGWLVGIIISIIHIVYVVLILSYPPKYLTEGTMPIDWLSLMPTCIFIIAVGLIGGYLGSKIVKSEKTGEKG